MERSSWPFPWTSHFPCPLFLLLALHSSCSLRSLLQGLHSVCARACVRMRVCVCVRVRACVCVCVCVCACVYVVFSALSNGHGLCCLFCLLLVLPFACSAFAACSATLSLLSRFAPLPTAVLLLATGSVFACERRIPHGSHAASGGRAAVSARGC